VFGRVIEGQDIIRQIEQLKVDSQSMRPLSDVRISNCGELVLQVRPKGMVPA
jgi:cyclophilin family peptidyl-prolyl cis-trans isomerase